MHFVLHSNSKNYENCLHKNGIPSARPLHFNVSERAYVFVRISCLTFVFGAISASCVLCDDVRKETNDPKRMSNKIFIFEVLKATHAACGHTPYIRTYLIGLKYKIEQEIYWKSYFTFYDDFGPTN